MFYFFCGFRFINIFGTTFQIYIRMKCRTLSTILLVLYCIVLKVLLLYFDYQTDTFGLKIEKQRSVLKKPLKILKSLRHVGIHITLCINIY